MWRRLDIDSRREMSTEDCWVEDVVHDLHRQSVVKRGDDDEAPLDDDDHEPEGRRLVVDAPPAVAIKRARSLALVDLRTARLIATSCATRL